MPDLMGLGLRSWETWLSVVRACRSYQSETQLSSAMNKVRLRRKILLSLRKQGFRLAHDRLIAPALSDKASVRALHSTAVHHAVESARHRYESDEGLFLARLATGEDVVPDRISPRLVQVVSGSDDERLFRYLRLHWSIPTSAGYGRRLRYLVVDQQNEKLIGLIGLADPVMNLQVRDRHIGWNLDQRKARLGHVMDAFLLGAVPPYSYLLCGKLVAMLATSRDVRRDFQKKYGGRSSVISGKRFDGRLVMVTTTSALGRSSVYNRLRANGRSFLTSVGYTQGSGDFHFANGVYSAISDYAGRYCDPTAKQEAWGTGFRNKREVVKKCLQKVGLPTSLMYHGLQREVFVGHFARNSAQFLRGEHSRLQWDDLPLEDIASIFRERWLLPRAIAETRHLTWQPDQWRLFT